MEINIKEHAKKWREDKLKHPCEFCLSEPREVTGVCGILDNFVYGNKCSFCFGLIDRDRVSNEQLIKFIGPIK